jgi:EmrB/QacA subfamily drug resistance transporter
MTTATRSPSVVAGADRLGRRASALLLVLCGAMFLDALDVSMTGVALPSIRSDLGMSTGSLQWVVSGYILGFGGFLLLGGRAADLLGRRRMFLVSLGVFALASGLGGLASDGALLIATRFIKGVAAAFTAPAGLSIITTTLAEGPVRNRALAIYTATGATGFSLGLVFSGLLTELHWRWVFFFPVPIALAALLAASRLLRDSGREERRAGGFDVVGAVTVTAAMLLLVFTIVEAPGAGWGGPRTLLSLAAVAALLAVFVAIEQRAAMPLVRLGILRSRPLVRANLGAMALFGGWVGVLFIATLYMQQVRGWSALETGLAVFPAGVAVVAVTPRVPALVARFGLTRMIVAGLLSHAAAYALMLSIGVHTDYATTMLPAFLLVGLGFALAFGPLNIAATNGVAAHEQGLAGGLLTSSFQLGGALVLAVATAVNETHAGAGGSPQALLDGYQAAIVVSLGAALLGAAATAVSLRGGRVPRPAVAHGAGCR